LLLNHKIIPPQQYPLYYNLPVKTNKFTVPKISTDLFSNHNNQLPTPLPYTTSIPLTTPDYSTIAQQIKICSLNINSLTSHTKQLLIQDYITTNNIDIFGISETHFSTKELQFSLLSKNLKNYKLISSSFENPHQAGTCILIKAEIAKHIRKIQNFLGHISCIDLYFKNTQI
jgi:hypothetical protein